MFCCMGFFLLSVYSHIFRKESSNFSPRVSNPLFQCAGRIIGSSSHRAHKSSIIQRAFLKWMFLLHYKNGQKRSISSLIVSSERTHPQILFGYTKRHPPIKSLGILLLPTAVTDNHYRYNFEKRYGKSAFVLLRDGICFQPCQRSSVFGLSFAIYGNCWQLQPRRSLQYWRKLQAMDQDERQQPLHQPYIRSPGNVCIVFNFSFWD